MSIKADITHSETIDCPLCGSTHYRRKRSGPDYFMRLPGTFHLVECRVCGLLYQNPRPALAEIGRYYPNHYGSYDSAQAGLRGRRGMMGWILRRGQHKRCRLIERSVPAITGAPRRLLDVGCASGLFLEAMQGYAGWKVEGVELNQTAARATSARLGVPIFAGPIEHAQFLEGSFDAITMWDVLEHLHNPVASLHEIRRILKPGGALFVRVPNAASYVARLCGRYWSGYDLPRHMTLFTPRTLAQALAHTGFDRTVSRYSSGSYLAALHSLRFAMDDRLASPSQTALIHRLLFHPVARAIAWLPFTLADRIADGSNLEVLVFAREH
jgi:2-polyprenyl-3-methyl-5-hydroxy-6-metoxy-1,4-benzoquinol methylase